MYRDNIVESFFFHINSWQFYCISDSVRMVNRVYFAKEYGRFCDNTLFTIDERMISAECKSIPRMRNLCSNFHC